MNRRGTGLVLTREETRDREGTCFLKGTFELRIPAEPIGSIPHSLRITPFSAGRSRRRPRLTAAPFRYGRYADSFAERTRRCTGWPIKQAAIAPASGAMYPAKGMPDYSRGALREGLMRELETEARRCRKTSRREAPSPFCDDTSTTRDNALAGVRARVEGNRLAERELGLLNE